MDFLGALLSLSSHTAPGTIVFSCGPAILQDANLIRNPPLHRFHLSLHLLHTDVYLAQSEDAVL